MHVAALAYVAAHVPRTALSVLEFGSRNINGSPRTVVPPGCRYVGVDIERGFGVDIVANAATVVVSFTKHGDLAFTEFTDPTIVARMFTHRFDAVICAEVFEHTDDETCAAICANAARHLVTGGVFVATMAGLGREPHSAVDGGTVRPGEFYRNVDAALLRTWLDQAQLTHWNIDQAGEDIRCKAIK